MPRQVGRKLYLTALLASAAFGAVTMATTLVVVGHDWAVRERAAECVRGVQAERVAAAKPAFDPSKPFVASDPEGRGGWRERAVSVTGAPGLTGDERAELERLRKKKRAAELREKMRRAADDDWVDEDVAWDAPPTEGEIVAAALRSKCQVSTWRDPRDGTEEHYASAAWSFGNLSGSNNQRAWLTLSVFTLLPAVLLWLGRRWWLWLTAEEPPPSP